MVYTNIKNMKLGEDLDKTIQNAGGLASFFNNKYQEIFYMNSNVIYIIDEAQSGNYFHRKFYSGDECFKTKRIKQDQKGLWNVPFNDNW